MEVNVIGEACNTYGERRGACKVLVAKPEVMRPLEITRLRWRIILI
jgi:hypothetical protein